MVRPMIFAAFVSIAVLGSAFAEEPVGADPYAPYPLAQITDDIRSPAAKQPRGTVSRHGEIEYLAENVFGTHWYISANDAVWHLVTAGNPDDETNLFVYGHPDT